MDPSQLAILSAAALATSILSAVVGMAGGITLLSIMLLFFEPLIAIPLHGVIQLVSNGSRAVIQRQHVQWPLMAQYGVLLIPMGFLGLAIARQLPPSGLKVAIGIFVLAATWKPGWMLLGAHPERIAIGRRFFVLGGLAGILNVTIGAVGPLIAPFFLNIGLTRQSMIGTKAACQFLGHGVKIVIFGIGGFMFLPYLIPLSVLSLMVVIGTRIGSRILEGVNEIWFTRIYKGVLTAIALRLVIWDGLATLGLRS